MSEEKKGYDLIDPRQPFSIGKRVVYIRPWSLRMVMKDVPYILGRIFDRLKTGDDVTNLAEVISTSSDEIVDLICKSTDPHLTPDEVYGLPASVGIELVDAILEQNMAFFVRLSDLVRKGRGIGKS